MQKILLVDDHQMFADGIQFLIEHTTDYDVVGVLNSGRDVLPFLAANSVSILLLDIDLPDISGFDLARTIRDVYPDMKILALSMLDDYQSISRMIEAGVSGYCIKSAGSDELFAAIRAVGDGHLYLPPSYDQPTKRAIPDLTLRETEVLQLIVRGISTNGIAETLFLSARTVETHRKNIYRKLGIHTNVELTLYAQIHQLL